MNPICKFLRKGSFEGTCPGHDSSLMCGLFPLVGFARLAVFANLVGLKIEFYCSVFVWVVVGCVKK